MSSKHCSKKECNPCPIPCPIITSTCCKKSTESHCKCKCDRSCDEYYPWYKTKCGFVAICLSVDVEPQFFTEVGQVITYIYTITNVGSTLIDAPLKIFDDRLGTQLVPRSYIPCGESVSFSRTYTIIAEDLLSPVISSKAIALIEPHKCKWVISNSVCSELYYGYNDVSGMIAQSNVVSEEPLVTVTVVLSNSSESQSDAKNVKVVLPYPLGLDESNVFTLPPILPATTSPVLSANGITIEEPLIPIGASYQYQFTYVPVVGYAYTFNGTITSDTYDYNLSNNSISNTIIV